MNGTVRPPPEGDLPWSSWPRARRRDVWAAVDRACPHRDTARDARQVCGMIDVYTWVGPGMISPWDPGLRKVEPFSTRDVRRYAARMRKGEAPPPVVLAFDNAGDDRDRLFILDGAHRVAAARQAGLEAIPAFVGGLPGRLRGRAAVALTPGRPDRDYCVCPIRDGKLYVLVPDAESLLRFLVTRRWNRDSHVKTAAGYVPHFGGAIAFHAERLVLKGFKPLWYSAAHPQDVIPQLLQDGVYTNEWEAHRHGGGHPEECEWIGPPQFAFEPEDVAEVWLPRFPARDLRSKWGRLFKQFVPKGVRIRRGLPRRIGTNCREGLAKRVAEGAGSTRWGGHAARAPQGVEWTQSPLDYWGEHPLRVQLVEPDAGPPEEGATYFAETIRREDQSPRTGRRYKTPKRVRVPGAAPGVVGFIDYEILAAEGGGVVPQIHYMAVRDDQRGRGVMRGLVAAFYERFAAAAWIDWGDIHHDAVAKLFRERRDAGARGEGPRTHGKVRAAGGRGDLRGQGAARSRFLPLAKVREYEDLARQRGVSEVARSPRGFLAAFEHADGDPSRLGLNPRNDRPWVEEREGFIRRTWTQARKQGRDLYETRGKYEGTPTRWHLALIMWAWSPDSGGI